MLFYFPVDWPTTHTLDRLARQWAAAYTDFKEGLPVNIIRNSQALEVDFFERDLPVGRHVEALLQAATWGEAGEVTTTEHVLKLHALLFPCGGVLRESGAELLGMTYRPPAPHLIRPQLCQWQADVAYVVANRQSMVRLTDRLCALARLHLRFVRIHPFTDGNGRVARVLLNGHAKYFDPCWWVNLTRQHRASYLAALEQDNEKALAEVLRTALVWLS